MFPKDNIIKPADEINVILNKIRENQKENNW
jgi:hypothetical protein